MTDKSAFTESEWHALTEAPMLVTAALIYVGEHGPISMVKEASASAFLTILLSFFGSRVTRYEPRLLESGPQFGIHLDQRASDPVANCASLSRGSAPIHVHQNIEFSRRVGQMQRLANHHPVSLILKILFKLAFVDDDLTGARFDEDSRGSTFPAARAVVLINLCHF